MIDDKMMIGYLTYVTDGNMHRRREIFEKSFDNLKHLKNQPAYLVNFDNNSSKTVKEIILNSKVFNKCFHFEDNYFEISVILGVAYFAKKMGFKYCLYTYDDFIVFNNNFVKDTITFLNANPDVHCVRVPEYSYKNMSQYDCAIVSKSKNPDSIRHFNTETQATLKWSDAINIGNNTFYKNNWHYTSRPTVWRTDVLLSFFDDVEDLPVMQRFETHACKKAQSIPLVTGVLDGGAMKTFVQSERMVVKNETGQTGAGKAIDSKVNKKLFLKLLNDLV